MSLPETLRPSVPPSVANSDHPAEKGNCLSRQSTEGGKGGYYNPTLYSNAFSFQERHSEHTKLTESYFTKMSLNV